MLELHFLKYYCLSAASNDLHYFWCNFCYFLSAPLTAPTEMIKCTFVVGGGKLVRSRYAEDLTKWLVAALREIGYTEDRSAAETYAFEVICILTKSKFIMHADLIRKGHSNSSMIPDRT